MTRIFDDPADFATDVLDGLIAAHPDYVARVDGGVVRSTTVPAGQVAVVIGGGSGHYPSFAGLVGPGIATGSACGNLFASPSVGQIHRVSKAAHHGGGVLLSYGNYAGDVLNFDAAERRLRAEGIDARTVRVTDDIASAPLEEIEKRRGIAGDFVVFKIAGAAAEAGFDLDEVERLARRANARTRSLGVAFAGCTLPGATEPLFTVPEGMMSVGLGIHGEPGIFDIPMPTATELAELLVSRLLVERPEGAGERVAVILNGLGTVKYEELYILYRRILPLLEREGLRVVEPEVGEIVTSLDMSGLSLTLSWLDDELETLWSAAADTPAYRKGVAGARVRADAQVIAASVERAHEDASSAARRAGGVAAALLEAVAQTIDSNADELGRIDAIAGDGDHGIGMKRGIGAAVVSARASAASDLGVHELLSVAAERWSEEAGGTSGALWAGAITAIADRLGNGESYGTADVVDAARAGLEEVMSMGKAEVGDKTMIDAMVPYVDKLGAEIEAGSPLALALARAAETARDAAEATASLSPRLGRARPLAAKSIGHPDAGAISFGLIVARIADEARALTNAHE
ncbi:MAG: homodimeric dihydroxyacetone kinase [Glaciihabitans sp.]|nr:homodimeric dihydroxyacetone kinase [Glaciihabitans sp.]